MVFAASYAAVNWSTSRQNLTSRSMIYFDRGFVGEKLKMTTRSEGFSSKVSDFTFLIG
jgi:hypothetical protein